MSEPLRQIIPAQPGYWMHWASDEEPRTKFRFAIVGWLVDCRPRALDWIHHVEPLTCENTYPDEYFIEQPDGTCFDMNGVYPSVNAADLANDYVPKPSD